MLGKDKFKKAIGNDKIIGGIVLILFGIGGIVFGVNIYNNQNFVQSCNSISGSINQSNSNTVLPCVNQPGLSILSIVPIIIGIVILIIGIVILAKGLKNKKLQKQFK
jgi:hypothetical protein